MTAILVSILAAWPVAGAPPQEPPDPRASAVAPFVGDGTFAVLVVDLESLDLDALTRQVLAGVMDPEEIDEATGGLTAWLDSLREAGARTIVLVVDAAEMPGLPSVVVPIAEGADAEAIGRILCGAEGESTAPVSWPTCASIRGAVFAGTDAALERVRAQAPADRPGFSKAFSASGDAPVLLLISPSDDQRRVAEELLPVLPGPFEGTPVTALTRGLRWASFALEDEPRPTLRLVAQASGEAAARRIEPIARDALRWGKTALGADASLADLVRDLDRITVEVDGDRLQLTADLEQASALIGTPIRSAREVGRRSRCVNNLKHVALAMHNYHSVNKSFPPAFSTDAEGRPLLSWRVHLLPFMEAKSLYDEFHLHEPWDSPHNAALIPRMPEVFRCPSAGPVEEGMTTYLTPRGEGTIFPGSQGVTLKEITDGTSNTILVVDAEDELAVSWTRPQDWEVGEGGEPDVGELLGNHRGGFEAVFADGSARYLRETISPETIKKLLTRAGGEVISSDDY
jgi:hypothetical protein